MSMVEVLGDEDVEAVEAPLAPAVVFEAEHGFAGEDAGDVETHGGAEVVLDEAEHLVGLVDLDGTLFETVVIAEGGDAGDVDAGDGAAAEVDGNAIRLAMRECGLKAKTG